MAVAYQFRGTFLQTTTRVYQLDPISDARWSELVGRHPNASIFHTVGWLDALRKTYGYQPTVFTASPPDEPLKNGLVFSQVESWITGRRLVSLPFSDHCDPLCNDAHELSSLLQFLQSQLDVQKWKYIEIRPTHWNPLASGDSVQFLPGPSYSLHVVDLRPPLNAILKGLDKNSVQRRIRRANRSSIVEKCGRSEDLAREFYRLFVVTRKRHRIPPVPYAWFQNLLQTLGSAIEIRMAYHNAAPIAGIVTLRFRDVVYFKYGCSDASYNKLGVTPWLFWQAISDAKGSGATSFDLGRTLNTNLGLLKFKNNWAPNPQPLVYWQYPYISGLESVEDWKLHTANRVFSRMPNWMLKLAGNVAYRHIG